MTDEPATTVERPSTGAPRWDTSAFFASLDSRELARSHEELTAGLARLRALLDQHGVRGGPPRPVDAADGALLDEVLGATNELLDRVRLVTAFLYAHISTDARDDRAAGLHSQLQQELAGLGPLQKRLDAWIARLGARELRECSTAGADHAFVLERAVTSAAHQMSEAEEDLASELRLSGSAAWARLHRDVTSRLHATLRRPDGTTEDLPMSVVRGLAHDPDAATRRAAYEAELDAWRSVEVPLAAALNGAKGETQVVNRRRGWADALEPALFHNNVDRATLDAMTAAVVAALPDFHRFLRAKASLLGHGGGGGNGGGLPWYDLFAPVAHPDAPAPAFAWDRAAQHVRDAFGTYSPALERLAVRALDESWIDAEPRDGKVGGAFCMPVRGDESRVLLNFDGSFDSVQTLAHELGHAYHNTNLATRTALQRQTPMALAETASIFCETIVIAAGLDEANDAERLVVLNTDLQGATQVVVDIHSRFLFERELCARRAARTLSVPELNEMMLDAQRAAYGDGLDGEHLHPYMWAVKGHYFTPFYNWPYTFGLLFGIGLYARFRAEPDRFRSGYDDLLASTGMGSAAELAARFDIDVRAEGFWRASLGVLAEPIDDFCALAAGAAGSVS